MSQTIQAVYENGVFKPLQAVSIPDHKKVELKIVTLDDWQTRFDAVLARLRAKTAVHGSEEVEEEIRLALKEARKKRRAL